MARGGEAGPAEALRPGGDLSGLYAAIVASSGDAVVGLAPDGTIVSWNPAAEALFGYAEAEAVGRSVFVTVGPEQEAELRGLLARIARGEHVRHYETVRVRKDGGRVPVSISLSPIHGPDGAVIGASKITRDVSERRSTEERFRESESRLRAVMDNLPDGAVYQAVRDADGGTRFTFLSAGIERLFGVTPSAAMADPDALPRTVYEEDRGRFLAEELESLRTLRRFDCEFRHIMPDGEVRWAHARSAPRRTAEGEVVWEGVVTDATGRKRAEEAVRESEERLRRVFDSNAVGLIVADFTGRLVDANDAFLATVGYTQDDLRAGRLNFHALTPPEYRPLDEAAMAEMLRTGRHEPFEKEYVRKDGSRASVLVGTAYLGKDRDGNDQGVGFIVDLSKQKAAERALRSSERRLKRLFESNLVGVGVSDRDGGWVEANDELLRVIGYDREELRAGKVRWRDMTPEGYLPLDERAIVEAGERGACTPYEKEYVRKDGTRVPVLLGYATLDEPGRYVCFVLDLSETRRVSDELSRSEERFRGLMDQAPFSVQILSADGRTVRVNRAWEELWGLRLEQLAGYNVLEDPQLEAKGVAAGLRKAFAGEPAVLPEIAYDPEETLPGRTRNEEPVRWISAVAYPIKDAAGAVREVALVHEDITARRKAEAGLRESEERFRAIVEKSVTGIAEVDLTGRFTFVNDRYCETVGRRREELLAGRRMQDMTHPDDLPKNLPLFERLVREGTPFVIEKRYVRPDGSAVWVSNSVSAVRDSAGRAKSVLAVSVDVTDRRRAEERSRESEQRSRSILESITDAFYAVRRDWRFTYLNHEAERILGRSREDLIGKHIWEEFAPAVETPFYDAYHRAMAGTETVRFEVFYPPHERWYEVHAYPSPDGIAVYFRDVTERREIEAALRESEARFRGVVESDLVGIGFWRGESIVDANGALLSMLGYSREEIAAGRVRWTDITPPEYAEADRKAVGELTLAGRCTPFEKEYVRRDGSRVPVLLGAVALDERRENGAFFALDVSARKRAEESLRFLARASAALAGLSDPRSTFQKLASVAVPVFADWAAVDLVEADGGWRRAAVSHLDPAKVRLAHALVEKYPPRPDDEAGVGRVLRTGRPELVPEISDDLLEGVAHDREHLRAVRELGLRSYVCVPMESRGRVIGALSFVFAESGRRYDEADLRTAEDLARRAAVAVENARLYDELREADRRKDDFLAMLAHELRNPLAPIKSGLELLRMEGGDSEVVGVMAEQVGHVVRLVDDLLDVSRILRGKVELKKGPTDLTAVARRAAETVRPRAEEHRQRLVVSVPGEPVRLEADPVRLTQVVTNLLHNASKYTDDGGEIRLSVSREGGEAVVTVSDTGIGIARELLPRVFDLFTQADQALDRAQGGLGIGLTVVKSLVEMHGGRVQVASDGVGRGSTFSVRLPIVEPAAVAAEAEAGPDGGRRRVLVVDDNVPAAKLLGRLLAKLGSHEVRLAHDGAAAVAEAASFRPDLILLDIGLPKMDGYEVARRLRGRPELDGALLVALTGYGTAEDRRRSLEAGFDDHLVKPPDVEVLRRVLARPKAAR